MELPKLKIVSTVDALVNEITRMIFESDVKPGDQLIETELCKYLNVSRNSLREAFTFLVNNGLLVKEKNRGVFVKKLSSVDVNEIYNLRLFFEREAVITIIENSLHLDSIKKALSILENTNYKNEWFKYVEADIAFHKSIVDVVGNSRFSNLYKQHLYEYMLCIRQSRLRFVPSEVKLGQHFRILSEIEKRDKDKAIEAVMLHLTEGCETIIKCFEDLNT